MMDYSVAKAVGTAAYDLFNTSHAEVQKQLYKKVMEKLEENLEIIAEKITVLEDVKQDMKNLEENVDEAEGKIQSVFEEKQLICKTHIEQYATDLSEGYQGVSAMLGSVAEKYEYWCSEVEREKRELYGL